MRNETTNSPARGRRLKRGVMPPLPIGTTTKWGEIGMVAMTGGERYYWCEDKNKVVSMMPAKLVEESAA